MATLGLDMVKLVTRAEEIRNWIDDRTNSEEKVFLARQEAQILMLERPDLPPMKIALIAIRRV